MLNKIKAVRFVEWDMISKARRNVEVGSARVMFVHVLHWVLHFASVQKSCELCRTPTHHFSLEGPSVGPSVCLSEGNQSVQRRTVSKSRATHACQRGAERSSSFYRKPWVTSAHSIGPLPCLRSPTFFRSFLLSLSIHARSGPLRRPAN